MLSFNEVTKDENTILKSEVGFEFKKIGRAPNDDQYFYYRQAVIAVDDKQYVFQKTSDEDWDSVGSNGYRTFKDLFDEGKIKRVIFDDGE